MTNKATRFFFHYYKQFDCLSIHFKGKCHKVQNIKCSVPVETKHRKTQPRLIVQGFAKSIKIDKEIAYIE